MRRRLAVIAALLVSCSTGAEVTVSTSSSVPATTTRASTTTTSSTTTSSTTSTTTTSPPPSSGGGGWSGPSVSWPPYTPLPGVTGTAALTGLAVDPATAALPIVAVKIDNASPARGQYSLDAADVIFEENVEFMTRFIALFHSRQPAEAGPVRSARSGDLYILAAMNRPVLAWSGGNAGVTQWVEAAAAAGRLVNLSFLKVPCYRREESRPRPHNLILSMACARSRSGSAGPARPLFRFSTESAVPTGVPTPGFGVRMDNVDVRWDYDPATGRYLRSQDGAPHLTAGGVRVAFTNVVVMSCTHIQSPVEPRSPAPVTVGSGRVVVHTGGLARSGTWRRAVDTDPWTFVADDGTEILLEPGTAWVELSRG